MDNTLRGWFEVHKGDRVKVGIVTGYAITPGVVTFVGEEFVVIDAETDGRGEGGGLLGITFAQMTTFRSLEP